LNGGARVFKIRVAGDEDNFDLRIVRVDVGGELQAGHDRHADIGDDDLGLLFFNALYGV